LHELHDPELHPAQPEEVCFSTPLIPNVENFFTTLSEVQFGQDTADEPNTSFSNSRLQAEHLYSKIGIAISENAAYKILWKRAFITSKCSTAYFL